MIPEILLTISCLSGKACDETRYTYLHYNPETRAYLNNVENKMKQIIPKNFYSDRIIPVLVAASRGEFTVHLNKNMSLAYDKKEEVVAAKLTLGMEY